MERLYATSRVLFIHSITDGLIPLEKYEQNTSVLQLGSENLVPFETGNHNQNKNELGIISAIDCFHTKKMKNIVERKFNLFQEDSHNPYELYIPV